MLQYMRKIVIAGKVVEVHVREQLQKNRYESLEKIMLASDQKMKATPVLTASRPTLAMELPYRSVLVK